MEWHGKYAMNGQHNTEVQHPPMGRYSLFSLAANMRSSACSQWHGGERMAGQGADGAWRMPHRAPLRNQTTRSGSSPPPSQQHGCICLPSV